MRLGRSAACASARERAKARCRSDGAEVLGEVGLGHADAGVGDRQRPGRLVGQDADLRVGRERQGRVGQGLEAAPVDGVGGVGHQLAQEDLALGVEGVDDQVQGAPHLGANSALRVPPRRAPRIGSAAGDMRNTASAFNESALCYWRRRRLIRRRARSARRLQCVGPARRASPAPIAPRRPSPRPSASPGRTRPDGLGRGPAAPSAGRTASGSGRGLLPTASGRCGP